MKELTYGGTPCQAFSVAGPRYMAIGNSMAVPVMRWIGRKIKQETRGK